MRRTSKTKGGIVIEGLLIIVGLGLMLKAGIVGLANYQFMHGADIQPITGTIVGVSDHGFTATTQYTLHSGEKITFSQKGFFVRGVVGQQVPVLYDPTKTGLAVIDKLDVVWFMSVVYGVPGLLMFFIGLRRWMVRSL